MRVLLLTDIHGHHGKLEKIINREKFDAILCAGDLGDAKEFDDYEVNLGHVLDAMDQTGKMAKAVPGNMDKEEVCVRKLIERRMNIHKKIASFEKFEAVGFGGGKTPFDTFFEPDGSDIRNAISTLHGRMKADKKVAVIHQPPFDTRLDTIENEHVGSEEVRELIEETDFDLVLTGHIHEARGVDELGSTRLVNPGPVVDGFYGVADVDEGFEIELKQL
ncbi:MAG: metallophosphoesterase [Candidatus Nanohaloarchaea archaeon]